MTNRRQQMGKVKLRVRENALRMRAFTVEQMVKATGFNQESVQSEIRRMKDKGFLTVATRVQALQRGAPPCLYSVSEDPEIRLKLASEIQEFYPKAEKEDYPTSQHYFNAQDLLDQVESGESHGSARTSLLDNAKDELEFAWHEEGEPKGAVDASIKCQLGRLEYLRGNYAKAEEVFLQAQRIFDEVGSSGQQHCGQEYLSAIAVKRQWEGPKAAAAGKNQALIGRIEAAMLTLQNLERSSLTNNPLSAVLVGLINDLLEALKESMRDLAATDAQFQSSQGAASVRAIAATAVATPLRLPLLSLHKSAVEPEGWSVRAEPVAWTHNLLEDYQYADALRIGSPAPLQFVALNSALGKGHFAASLETDVKYKY